MADRAGWRHALESELRAAGRELDVPPAGDPAAAVRRRLAAASEPASRPFPSRGTPPLPRRGTSLPRRFGWRAALVALAACLAVLIATPQGRAVIMHVFRFAGVEVRQEPSPAPTPGTGGSLGPGGSMPSQRRMPLALARRQVRFPLLVPAALGPPGRVLVSDGGRVASLIYPRTAHGEVRVDEFAGRLDQVFFEKTVGLGTVTRVRVDGATGLWIRGPHALGYITRDGTPAAAPARLTTGSTLVWGTGQTALRLEGSLSEHAALTIARSAH